VTIVLRPMRWWDVEAVLEIDRAVFGPTAWTAELFWAELAQRSRTYLVAEPGAAGPEASVIGYAGLLVNGPEADVQTIGVAPAAQGRGLGALLVSTLVEQARAAGATALLLEVRADNDPAANLYRKFGFERIGVRRRYYQPGDIDAVIMRKRPL